MSTTRYNPSAPIQSSLDGKIVWKQGDGEIKIDSSTRAVSPNENVITVQKAIDALSEQGGGTLVFRAGTYTLANNLVVPTDVSLKGESFGAVNLVFAGPYGITLTGSLAYSTGTISVTKGSAIITGSGTSWLANVNPGHKIRINGLPYRITSVDSDTQITLASEYQGASASGLSYLAAHFVDTVELENLIVISGGSSGLTATYADLLTLKNVVFPTPAVSGAIMTDCARLTIDTVVVDGANATGMSFVNSSIINFNRLNIANCGSHGVHLDGCSIVTFQNSPMSSNGGHGVLIEDGANIGFLFSDASDNTGHGINIIGGATQIQVLSTSANRNVDGIKLEDTVTNTTIASSYATGNSGYGINVSEVGVEDTYIVGNQLDGNTTGDINDAGTGTVEIQSAGGGGSSDWGDIGGTLSDQTDLQAVLDDKADDDAVVHDTGDEAVAGIKTFSSFPITPSSAPSTDYQVANKKFVDDQIIASGSGDVVGPASATDDRISTFDGTTGKLIQDSGYTIASLQTAILGAIYKVGDIFVSTVNTNPSGVFGGTWVAFGSGKVMVGYDSGDTDFDTAEETGGAKTHTHTLSDSGYARLDPDGAAGNMKIRQVTGVAAWAGTVVFSGASSSSAQAGRTDGVGLGGVTDAGNSLQPYIVVFMFKKTA